MVAGGAQMTTPVRMSIGLLATTLLLAPAPASPARYGDPPIHQRASTGHYYVWIPIAKTWNDARAFSEKFSASYEGTTLSNWHLATITDAAENEFVFEVVLGGGGTSFLGALKTPGSLADFRWVTGEPFVYKNFAPGQPDFVRENALEMGGSWGAQWNDQDGPGAQGEASNPFILEHEPLRMSALSPR